MILTDAIFGQQHQVFNLPPNLLIRGITNLITNKEELAIELNINTSEILSFKTINDEIQAYINIEYTLTTIQHLKEATYIEDEKIIGIDDFILYPFKANILIFRNLTSLGRASIANSRVSVYEIYLPKLQSLSDGLYSSNNKFPIENIYIPEALSIGATSGKDDDVLKFLADENTISSIYLHPSIATINNGNEDLNIKELRDIGTEIVYVQNKIKPEPILNLIVSGIYADKIILSFSQSTSINNIENFEVFVNDRIQNTCEYGSIIAAKKLNPDSNYRIKIRAVDTYYNKSDFSDEILISTNSVSENNSIAQQGLIFSVNTEDNQSFLNGDKWNSLVGNNWININSNYFTKNNSFLIDNGVFTNSNITIPDGADFTFSCFMKVKNWKGANPGLWRSGNYFNIFQSNTGRPWIRWGSDILRPSSGYQLPLNEWVYVTYVVKSHTAETAGYAKFLVNGEEKHIGSHTKVTPQINISFLIIQSNNEVTQGFYKALHFYSRSLSVNEIQNNYNQLLQKFKFI